MKKSNTQYFGIGALLSATFVYSFFGILSRVIGYSIPLFYQTGLRSLVATVILAVIIFFTKQWKPLKPIHYFWIILRSIAGTVAIITFFVAINSLPMGTTYFIFYAGSTIGGYIIGNFLFKETLTPIKMVSLGLSLIGLYLIYSLAVDHQKLFYILISLLSGLATAAWNTFAKKIPNIYSSYQITFLDDTFATLFPLFVSLLIGEQWVIPTITIPWGVNVIFGCLYIITGQLVIYGFRRLDAQIGSLVMLTEVLFGILVGYIFYQEFISITAIIGGLLIIGAIVLPEIKIFYRINTK